MKPADVAWPLRERNSLEISTRVKGTKHVQVGSKAGGLPPLLPRRFRFAIWSAGSGMVVVIPRERSSERCPRAE